MLHSLLCWASYVWGLIFVVVVAVVLFLFLSPFGVLFCSSWKDEDFCDFCLWVYFYCYQGILSPWKTDLFPFEGTDQVRQRVPLGSSRAWAQWSPSPCPGHEGTLSFASHWNCCFNCVTHACPPRLQAHRDIQAHTWTLPLITSCHFSLLFLF